MGQLTITARFPLGFFQGHGHDGDTPDPYPQTARLFDALVHAAGKGATAVAHGSDLRPSEDSLTALKWLESRAPDRIQLARYRPNAAYAVAVSYRDEGVFDKANKTKAVVTRKVGRRINRLVAVDGAFGWEWHDVPASIVKTVEELCADVSCLGEADSPVVLDTTIELDQPMDLLEGVGQLSTRGIPILTPKAGRVEELEQSYAKAHPEKLPTLPQDRHLVGQHPTSPKPAHRTVGKAYYEPLGKVPTGVAPWPRAMLFKVSKAVPVEERVRWCVAFHRLLARRLGDDAPAVVTGVYQQGVPKPANRVAIQYLPAGLPARERDSCPLFAVMLPSGMSVEDEAILHRALRGPALRLYRDGRERQLEQAGAVGLLDWWDPPAVGMQRWWAPIPGLVPDTRRQPSQNGSWTLEHAAKLAVGFAFRERLTPVLSGERGYRDIVKQVEAFGVRATQLALVPNSRVEIFAHKLPVGVTCQPYRGLLHLGDLIDPTALLALGQSRHVGGGLLLPVDVPQEVSALWMA